MTKKDKERIIEQIKSILKDNYMLFNDDEHQVMKEALNALFCLQQYRWERDIAVGQLEELGLSLGKKIDGVYLTKEKYEDLLEYMEQNKKELRI